LDAPPDAGNAFKRPLVDPIATSIRDLVDGGISISKLDEAVRADFVELAPWVSQIAACTRAPATGAARGLRPLGSWDDPRDRRLLFPGQVALVLAVQVRTDLEANDRKAALEHCGDLLALTRDTVADQGLIGAMHATAMVKSARAPCGDAIRLADPELVRRFLDEVRQIRAGSLSFKRILEIEKVEMQILAFGPDLSAGQTAQLSPDARALAHNALFEKGLDVQRIAGWVYWRSFAAEMDELIAAADGPDRNRIFGEVQARHGWLDALASGPVHSPGMLSFARRYEAVMAVLDLLESAGRVGLGDAPLANVLWDLNRTGLTVSTATETFSVPAISP
jgi:hypothetical protein